MRIGSPGTTKTPSQDSLSLLPRLFGLSPTPELCEILASELLFRGFWAAFSLILSIFITFQPPHTSKTLKINERSMIFQWFCCSEQHYIGQHWSALTNIDQYWSPMANIDQHWSALINTDQHWSPLMDIDQHRQHWPTLINVVQHWSTLFNIDHHWWTLIEHAILFHSIPSPPLCVHQRSRNPHTGFWKLRNLLRPSYPLGIWLSIRSSTLPQNQSL